MSHGLHFVLFLCVFAVSSGVFIAQAFFRKPKGARQRSIKDYPLFMALFIALLGLMGAVFTATKIF